MTQVTPLATASHPFTIADVRIRQDAQGRYCLNDLHKAAVAQGANKRSKEPGEFFKAKRTQELVRLLEQEFAEQSATENPRSLESDAQTGETITENLGDAGSETITENLRNAPVVRNVGGSAEETGTYVCIELVIAYGQFVSAAFDLKVIRTFLAVVNQQHAMPHIQSAKFWDRLRPHWRAIADLALQGLKNVQIAPLVERSAGSVGRCLARMYEVGYLNPVDVFVARLKPATARRWALSKPVALGWGRPAAPSLQGDLFATQQEG
ncbi:KilA-N domain-containing protein [Allofranklinella schreckenbergeri]|nr:KilA-N domain-containing protein [Allofranklinella schreckenbergeri]